MDIMKERAVKQFIAFQVLFYISVYMTGGYYVEYLREHGLTLLQVNLVNCTFFATLFICEIPTGAFADTFGRKHAIALSCILRGLGAITYGLSDSFIGFVLAEVISAVGLTFMNGAFTSWLVDTLKHHGYASVSSKVFSRTEGYAQGAGAVAAIIGSYLGAYWSRLPWFIEGGIGIVVGIVAHYVLTEEYFVRTKIHWKDGLRKMLTTAKSSMHYTRTEKVVRFILVINLIQIFTIQGFNMYWQPFFEHLGLTKIYFGWIFAGIQGMLVIGALILSRMNVGENEKKILIYSQIVTAGIILLAVISPNWQLALMFFLLHEVMRGMWKPLKTSYLHKRIPSHERATIDSFSQIAPHIGGTFGLLVSGLIAQYGSISATWIFSSVILIGSALLLLKNGKTAGH
jgi:MFS transporter, DHA3 family, tetracycline resistance protein